MSTDTGEPPRSKPSRPRPRDERQTRRRLRLVLLFVSMIVLADALVGERGLIERYRAQREYEALAAEIGALHTENTALRARAERLRTDPDTIERVARRDLGLIRPGEIVVLVNAEPPKSRRGPTPPARRR